MALRSPRLALLLKGVIFGLLLNWYYAKDGSVFYAVFFAIFSLVLYIRPLFGAINYWRSFVVLMALLSLPPVFYQLLGFGGWACVIIGALLFYLILGLKELVLINRQAWHRLIFTLLLYGSIFAHFLMNDFNFFTRSLAVFLISFLLGGEFLRLNIVDINLKAARIFAFIFAFLIFQGLWIAGWLPIGFINSANLVALSGFVFAEAAVNFYGGRFGRKMFFSRVIIWTLLALFIFLTSRWLL